MILIMKYTIIRLIGLVMLSIILFCPGDVQAQPPPPPPPGEHGLNGNQGPGGSASLDGGILILLVMGAGYGIRKIRKLHRHRR
jgi:hypothetical protein